MNILKCFSLSLVLFMLACGNSATKKVETAEIKENKEQVVNNIAITTFDMVIDSSSNGGKSKIGSRSMGNAKSGEQLEDKFAIKNVGDKPIVVLDAKSNCGCLQVNYSKEPIKVGDSKTMTYTYDSRGKVGQQFSEVTIKTNVGEFFVLVDLFLE